MPNKKDIDELFKRLGLREPEVDPEIMKKMGVSSMEQRAEDLVLKKDDTGIFLKVIDDVGNGLGAMMISFRVDNPKDLLLFMGQVILKAADRLGLDPPDFCAHSLQIAEMHDMMTAVATNDFAAFQKILKRHKK